MIHKEEGFWYQQPAAQWAEALPMGNGRLGVMIYGGTDDFRMQMDETTFWSGKPSEDNNRDGMPQLVGQVREALSKKEYEKADLLGQKLVGNQNQYGSNLPVGELHLLLLHATGKKYDGYERSLSLEKSIHREIFKMDEAAFERTIFVSNPEQVIAVRMRCVSGEGHDYLIRYAGIENNTCISKEVMSAKTGYGTKALYGLEGDAFESLHSDGKTGVHLEGGILVSCNGTQRLGEEGIFLEDVSELMIYMDIATTMFEKNPFGICSMHLEKAFETGFEEVLKNHVADYARLYRRMKISLGEEEKRKLPTDTRLKRAAKGETDKDLHALMFQYGRYLLIASSRENSPLPTHMGGIWNDNFYTKMDCGQDMHLDMNIQMQYWAAAVCGLPECDAPLLKYIEEVLVPSGTVTAEKTYNAGGWAAHVVSNPWGFTSLGWGYHWGVWALGGVWCTTLLWDYYSYTQDRAFLKERGYAIIKGAARFAADYVFWDEKRGFYLPGPSYSPENMYKVKGKSYYLDTGCTCDVILIREIFDIYEQASQIMGEDGGELLKKIKGIRGQLPPYQIGAKGQLQEWLYDYEEAIPDHRHTSHLLGVYPFFQIQPEQEELAEAVRTSIKMRFEGLEMTSWCMNMFLGYHARLGDNEEAWRVIQSIFKRLVRSNMTSVMSPIDDDTSIWGSNWELDGNTGFTAAMAEMLLQSDGRQIRILPALPAEWESGYMQGIRIRGNHVGDLYWESGKLKKFTLVGGSDTALELIYCGKSINAEICQGESYSFGEENFK